MSNHDRSLAKSILLHQINRFNEALNGALVRPIHPEMVDLLTPLAKAAGWEFINGDPSHWGNPGDDLTLVDLIVKLVELDCDEYSFAGSAHDIKRHLRAR